MTATAYSNSNDPSSISAEASSVPHPRIRIEQSLEQLLQSLLELGICASDVQDSALETSPNGVASGQPGGLIGRKASQTIENLSKLHSIKDSVRDILIPLEVISSVDQGRNPHAFTKDFIERLAGENMYTNGILSAVSDYKDLLTEQMKEAFPDLAPYLDQQRPQQQPETSSTRGLDTRVATESNGYLPATASPTTSLNGVPAINTNGAGYSNGSDVPALQTTTAQPSQNDVTTNGDVNMESDYR